MSKLSGITNMWNNVREIDLRPLQEQALRIVRLAVVGKPTTARSQFSMNLRQDPSREGVERFSPLPVLGLEDWEAAADAELIFVVVESGDEALEQEEALVRNWSNANKKVLVFVDREAKEGPQADWVNWGQSRTVYGPSDDGEFLQRRLAPEVIALLPERLLSLGRHFPLFRLPIANDLINDTSLSNATYSLSTGVAEIVPVFDIPLNVADMVVLTKAQAFLVYKLGLVLGMSTQWRDYVAEFGSVLGGGFFWRQIARSLVGLIPAWGIIPKVAVAYAGTYVVGNVVLQWYLTGRHVDRRQMQVLYREALQRGRDMARALVSRTPRPRLPIRRRSRKELPAPSEKRVCQVCGQESAPDAAFCQYCGEPLAGSLGEDEG